VLGRAFSRKGTAIPKLLITLPLFLHAYSTAPTLCFPNIMSWAWMPKFPWGGGAIPLAVHEQHVPEIQDEKAMQLVQEVPAAVESCSEGALYTIKCPSDGNYPRLEYVTLRPSLNQSTLLIFTHTHTTQHHHGPRTQRPLGENLDDEIIPARSASHVVKRNSPRKIPGSAHYELRVQRAQCHSAWCVRERRRLDPTSEEFAGG